MRKFIDPKGEYIFHIPNDWGHVNGEFDAKENDPNSFQLYEKSVGCFQISSSPITKGEIPNLIESNKLKPQEVGKSNLEFTEKYLPSSKFDLYLWFAVVNDKFIMCKYISDSDKKESKKVKNEIEKARRCLKSIYVVPEIHKEEILASERFTKFMNSLAASIDLRNRAISNASSIELVVLIANQIDALLRLTLILKQQIDNSTNKIDTTLIFQSDADKPIMEKSVYKTAFEKGIITEVLYNKLIDLYNQRNKVIHRYIITDLLTKDVLKIAFDYLTMEETIGEIVKVYEQKQFQLKIGIYGTNNPSGIPLDKDTQEKLIGAIREKHAHKKVNKGITIGEVTVANKRLAKKPNTRHKKK